jgi:uncharacterized membrane protein
VSARCRSGVPYGADDAWATCRNPIIDETTSDTLGISQKFCLQHAEQLAKVAVTMGRRPTRSQQRPPEPPETDAERDARIAREAAERQARQAADAAAAADDLARRMAAEVAARGNVTRAALAALPGVSPSARVWRRAIALARERNYLRVVPGNHGGYVVGHGWPEDNNTDKENTDA